MNMDKLLQEQQRNLVQEEARILSLSHKHLLLIWPTSSGKGKAVMLGIAASPSPKKWLIVVPEILQIDNYWKDIEKHGMSDVLRDKIEDIICYASLPKWEGKTVNLALNECHHLSELKWEISGKIDFDQIISDSATVPNDVWRRLMLLCPFYEYHISLNEAIDAGLLPPPTIYLVGITLDAPTRNKSIDWENKITAITKLIERKGYEPWMGNKLNRLGAGRKKFLAETKNLYAKWLLKKLEGKRKIVYTGSIDQSFHLGQERAINSHRTIKENRTTLNAFNNLEIDSIFTNKMLREGVNLDGIEAIVIVQLDSGKDQGLSFIQMSGRGLRADAPEIYIMYAKNTQDQVYLERMLKNIDKQYIVKI